MLKGACSPLQILLDSPILRESELEAIRGSGHSLKAQTFSLYYQSGKTGAMTEALNKLTSDIEQAVRDGCEIVILSDKLPEGESISIERPPIQTLLAVGATHHHLIKCVPISAVTSSFCCHVCNPISHQARLNSYIHTLPMVKDSRVTMPWECGFESTL